MKRVCVFCGSSMGRQPLYAEAAEALSLYLVRNGIGIVYGGASSGLMGRIADVALAAGGEVIGVMPQMLVDKEIAHRNLSKLVIVNSMHERKAAMADLSDAFIALPGGFGTLDEFCEIVTWAQLGIHSKPCGLLNVGGYFDALLQMFDHAVTESFLKPHNRKLVIADSELEPLMKRLAISSRATG
jgi:uncharacterized protein (TIGR00730 family)